MALATVLSRAQCGLEALPVSVEAYVGGGLPGFHLVGLPATAVRESRDRVRAALLTCGFKFPDGKVIVNLAPADLPKEGGRFDLPIALGVLIASGQLPRRGLKVTEFVGELSLNGDLRPVKASLCAAIAAARAGRTLVVPDGCAEEAALAGEGEVRTAGNLLAVAAHIRGRRPLAVVATPPRPRSAGPYGGPDLDEVRGQLQGGACSSLRRRAATISCSSARRAPARPCSRGGCRGCCRRSTPVWPWRSPRSRPRPGVVSVPRTGAGDRSGRRITRRLPWR
jgi:magnesium chelatase family protein